MDNVNSRLKIGLLLICTGKYDIFLQRLIDSLGANFFLGDDVVIYLFTDKTSLRLSLPERFSVIVIPTPHEVWPFPTLFRYRKFTEACTQITTDYLFYMDVDMLLVGSVDREILPGDNDGGLVATGHPGFWQNGGSWCNVTHSKAYVEENRRVKYVAGGFQGGETGQYLEACNQMARNIDIDYQSGFIAEWHDEQHWNCWVASRAHKLLSPEYCMIEEGESRIKYGISHLTPRIIALKKDHEEMRK